MEEEIVNEIKKKNRNNCFKFSAIIIVVALFVGMLMLGERILDLSDEKMHLITGYESVIENMKTELQSCFKIIAENKIKLEAIKNNNDLLKKNMFLYAEEKNQNDNNLLQDDMLRYIDNTFQFIPRTVVVNIVNEILSESKKHGISPELIMAIIEVESSFNPMAISKANARGLMQVMPVWAKKFKLNKVSDLHDIDIGIECGVKVLKIHINEEGGDLTKGLYKYVGRSDTYAEKVYKAIGKFVAYRSIMLNKKS